MLEHLELEARPIEPRRGPVDVGAALAVASAAVLSRIRHATLGSALRGHHLTDHRRGIRHWITSFLPAGRPGGPEPRRREADRRCRFPAPITGGPPAGAGACVCPDREPMGGV